MNTLGSRSQVNALFSSSYRFNVTKARQELAQSQYPSGFTARLDVQNYGALPDIAQVNASELQKSGISLTVNVEPFAKWLAEAPGSLLDSGVSADVQGTPAVQGREG